MLEPAGTLKRVLSTNCCTGCGACEAVFGSDKIRMQMVEPGYLRPVSQVQLTPEEDQIFADICPGIHLRLSSGEAENHPIWGPVIRVRVGAATDKSTRHRASSGGVLSALLNYLLENEEVQFVVHTAASASNPIGNETHESRDSDDVLRGAGSRYCPSSPLTGLKAQLERGEAFALLGKPCDIAAARALTRYDERINSLIPFMLSFFCAGVPSLNGTREILTRMAVRESELESFRFRGDGWPGYATAVTRGGDVKRMNYRDSWGNILSHHTQFRCKICPDGSGGFADVACGDAWHCDDEGYPLFEESEGRSLIVSRTRRGEELVKSAILAGFIETEDLSIDQVEMMQPSQARRKRLVLSRILALRVFTGNAPEYTGLKLREAARRASLYDNVRSFLGMTRRLLTGKKL